METFLIITAIQALPLVIILNMTVMFLWFDR